MKLFVLAFFLVVLVPTVEAGCADKETKFTAKCIEYGKGCGGRVTKHCSRLENKLIAKCGYICPPMAVVCGYIEDKFIRKCLSKDKGCGGRVTKKCSNLEDRLKTDCGYACPGTGSSPRQIEDLDLSGIYGNWEFTAEIRTTAASATIIGKAIPTADPADDCGEWKNASPAQGKMFFLRGGRLSFDIGWVGLKQGPDLINDGEWHFVGIRFEDDAYVMTLDDDDEYSYFTLKPNGIADPPGWETYFGFNIGHDRSGQTPCGGDMAKAFVGDIRNVYYNGEPLAGFAYT